MSKLFKAIKKVFSMDSYTPDIDGMMEYYEKHPEKLEGIQDTKSSDDDYNPMLDIAPALAALTIIS